LSDTRQQERKHRRLIRNFSGDQHWTAAIASFKEFSKGGTRLKILTQKSKVRYTPANFSSYWSSKLSFIQHYLWWRNSSQIHGLCNVRILDFCFVCLLPTETWRLLASGQNSRFLLSWAQYTFGCSQTSEKGYFWHQFLAVCDTSLLSRSTCCVEKGLNQFVQYTASRWISQKFIEFGCDRISRCERAGSVADGVADCVISERLKRLITKDLFYKFSCGGWFAVRLPPSVTNSSSTGRQNILTGRHFCRPVTMLNEAMTAAVVTTTRYCWCRRNSHAEVQMKRSRHDW